MDKFEHGKFTYDTFIGTDKVEITLDLTHPQIRHLIFKAAANKSRRAAMLRGALVVKVGAP